MYYSVMGKKVLIINKLHWLSWNTAIGHPLLIIDFVNKIFKSIFILGWCIFLLKIRYPARKQNGKLQSPHPGPVELEPCCKEGCLWPLCAPLFWPPLSCAPKVPLRLRLKPTSPRIALASRPEFRSKFKKKKQEKPCWWHHEIFPNLQKLEGMVTFDGGLQGKTQLGSSAEQMNVRDEVAPFF